MLSKLFSELLSLLKSFLVKNWRRPIALVLVLISVVYVHFFEVKKYVKGFEPNENSLPFLVLVLFLVTGVWFYARFKYKLAVRHTTFGVIINHENRSAEEIHRIIKPIISEVKSEVRGIKFIELDSNLFSTEFQANEFLKNNDYGLKQLLHIKADIGKVDDKEKFIIDSAVFRTYGMPTKFPVFGVIVDINKEVALRNPNQWSFTMADEYEGTKKTRLELRDILYYYLGLSSVCNGNPELGLEILKRLITPINYSTDLVGANDESISEEERIRKNKKFFLASRLVQILSGLCQSVFLDYHNSGKDPNLTMGFLKEYEKLLSGSREAIVTYAPLARYSYDLGNVEAARKYTEKAALVMPNSATVLLNRGFFAILDNSPNELSRNYKNIIEQIQKYEKAGRAGQFYNALDIIEFYAEQYAKHPDKKLFFDYAIAFHTILLVDTKEGVRLMNKFQSDIVGEPRYRALDTQARFLIKNAFTAKASARKSVKTIRKAA
ncbi:tetratricopeptide repeat protein [Hymenobacter terricola]|uniref:tetratricopeptide repeat protein n=1 Tax=Hymenobacter terricola TaxID=2819236 RepID=UPI001B300ED4|nr:hypothetical protein [Hymenobacter terricola]